MPDDPLAAVLLPAGVIADRLSRRGMLLASDLVSFACQGVLAALVISGDAQIWQFCALQPISGSALAFFLAPITGLTAQIVGPERMQQANALPSITTTAGNVAGPALAGLLVRRLAPATVAIQPLGYALVGVVASSVLSISATLWLAAAAALVSSVGVAAFPSIRNARAETHRRDEARHDSERESETGTEGS